jgi:small subunit ribosomal protein S24e
MRPAVELKLEAMKENKLLARREAVVVISHDGAPTPTSQQVRETVASQLGTRPELVFVRKILTEFGRGVSRAEIHIYESESVAKIVEPLYIVARNLPNGKALLEEAKKRKAEIREKKRRKKKGAAKKK